MSRRTHRLLLEVFLLLGLSVLRCSGNKLTGPLQLDIRPTAVASRSFGDAPVSGKLTLLPADDGSVWQYSVDLDGDQSADRSGTLGGPVEFDYSFSTIGIQRLLVTFSGSRGVVRDTAYVIVNDPDASSTDLTVDEPADMHGLAFASDFLFTTTQNAVQRRSAQSLLAIDSIRVEGTRLRGVSPSPDGRLYAISESGSILVFQLPEFRFLQSIVIPFAGGVLVDARRRGLIYAGGPERIAVMDATDGMVLAQRQFIHGRFFALGPNTDRIAFAVAGSEPRVVLLQGATLSELWTHRPGNMTPQLVAFSPSEAAVYVLGLGEDEELHYLALTADDGRVIRHLILEPCEFCFLDVGTSSFAHIEEYTLMPSMNGTYVIDSSVHLPVHRIGEREEAPACCNVASDPISGRIYLVVLRHSLHRVQVSP